GSRRHPQRRKGNRLPRHRRVHSQYMSNLSTKKLFSRRDFLKTSLAVGGGLLVAGGLGSHLVNVFGGKDYDQPRADKLLDGIPAGDPQSLPNIILILTDDMGLGDLSLMGSQAIHTPNLDQMAADGVLLTNFYSSAPVCSPSRAGLLTGRYPVRTLIFDVIQPPGLLDWGFQYLLGAVPHGIPEDEVLLPEIFQRRGYRTGLVGKWHLGWESPYLPNENGFDFFYGGLLSHDTHPYRIYRNDQVEIEEPVDFNFLTQYLNREAVNFVKENSRRPFFLYYAQHFPHVPLYASDQFRGQSEGGRYGDTVEELDWSVGEIFKTLRELGLDEKTLVIFTSDNGPWWEGDTNGLRGRKNLPLEGGFRVPMIARWTNTIPPGLVTDAPAMNFDLFSTSLAAAGLSTPVDRIIDGRNLLPLLTAQTDASPHETLFFYKGRKLVGVRSGDWKYYRRHSSDNGAYPFFSQGPFLFDLRTDPRESYNLLDDHPDLAEHLTALLDSEDRAREANPRGWL
ncbi:MAG TPA: sulfatase, partial [Anaerolineae bacterium]|nr:sulfatase [Anaerolineae bacterium]